MQAVKIFFREKYKQFAVFLLTLFWVYGKIRKTIRKTRFLRTVIINSNQSKFVSVKRLSWQRIAEINKWSLNFIKETLGIPWFCVGYFDRHSALINRKQS